MNFALHLYVVMLIFLQCNPTDYIVTFVLKVLYTMGGLENLQTAKKYYASTIQLTGGKNTRALFGVCLVRPYRFLENMKNLSCFFLLSKSNIHLIHILNTQCTSAINQLTKGRNKEEEGSELQSLAAEALLKHYKQKALSKVPLISSMLKNMKLS